MVSLSWQGVSGRHLLFDVVPAETYHHPIVVVVLLMYRSGPLKMLCVVPKPKLDTSGSGAAGLLKHLKFS